MSLDPNSEDKCVEVLLPLAIPKTYSYRVSNDLIADIAFGIRVEVPLRNKLYSGIVISIAEVSPNKKLRDVISVLDKVPIITKRQFQFWQWIASYYCAPLGSVMGVAMPAGLKLSSETRLLIREDAALDAIPLTDDEYLVAEAISIQGELTIDIVQDILDKKEVYPVIKGLLDKRILIVKEELKEKYKPRKETFVEALDLLLNDAESALEMVKRSEKQTRAIMAILTLHQKYKRIPKKEVYRRAQVESSTINALVKKGLIKTDQKSVSRIGTDPITANGTLSPMSKDQHRVIGEIKEGFDLDKVVLLHGITGSGKTRVYVEYINKVLADGGQVLYLLPEIALTAQMVGRLASQVNKGVHVYHSQINDQMRVELWSAALTRDTLFVGARSSLFLPFYNLKLIIIDEEHDRSFKQENPAPRYQARDSAIVLAKQFGAQVILGSGTPSLESIRNVQLGKYKLVEMKERFGSSIPPNYEIIDLKEAYKKGLVEEGFTKQLLDAIEETIANGEQIIIFQNRRGYAPLVRCAFCDWIAQCSYCDVSLTYHQRFNELKCHYCGFKYKKPTQCPDCGNPDLRLTGFGTEKIVEFLSEKIPSARVKRFDYDTTRSKTNQERILEDFRYGEIDILIGTQMITKGFDFENIGLVGVISADGLLSFPDFRSSERTFQLLMQVGGRAGRREKQGRVIIQAFNPNHPILQKVTKQDYQSFFETELYEREFHRFPPHYNLTAVWLSHRDLTRTKAASVQLSASLKKKLGGRIVGPVDPPILRLRNQYRQIVYVKTEKNAQVVKQIKAMLMDQVVLLKSQKDFKSVTVKVDVDVN